MQPAVSQALVLLEVLLAFSGAALRLPEPGPLPAVIPLQAELGLPSSLAQSGHRVGASRRATA